MSPVALDDLEAALSKYYPSAQPLFTSEPNPDPYLRVEILLRLAALGIEVADEAPR